MLRHVMAVQGRTHAAEASYNNQWGVPLTLARMPRETQFAVIEIGMNHPGEIAPLTRLARPHVAIVTTVAAAHLEAFANIEEIAREKAAIFGGLEPGGVAIFNADLPIAPVLEAAAAVGGREWIGFGRTGPGRRIGYEDITLTADASVMKATFDGVPFLLKVGAPGRHFAMNALAVVAAAAAVGGDWNLAACDLAHWHAPKGRGLRETLALDAVEELTLELIDDAFNANPASMAAAFEVLAAVPAEDGKGRVSRGRRIAILGDMLELGPDEAALHAELADHPAMASIDRVDCVGPRMRALWEALPEEKRGRCVESAGELAAEVHHIVDAGDVVLVKGSKGSRVSLVVDALRKLGASHRATGRQRAG